MVSRPSEVVGWGGSHEENSLATEDYEVNRTTRNEYGRKLGSAMIVLFATWTFLATAARADDTKRYMDEIKEMFCRFSKEDCEALPMRKLNPAYGFCLRLREFCWSSKGLSEAELKELIRDFQRYAMELQKEEGRT